MPAAVLFLSLSILGAGDLPGDVSGGWETPGELPCRDSAWGDAGYSAGGYRDWKAAPEDTCGDEASLLFSRRRSAAADTERISEAGSFSVENGAGGPPKTLLRQRAARSGWSHRLEFRGDSLTRRQLEWSGGGWTVLAGDLTDTALPVWPAWLPRRALPAGWRAVRGPPGPRGFEAAASSSQPQGVGAAVIRPAWKAYALQSWNPVESGREPPWRPSWDLRHAAAGASVSLPWIASAHFSETRASRSGIDSTSERLWSAGLASPGRDLEIDLARSEARGSSGDQAGWAAGTELYHRFTNDATIDFILRQRDSRWASAWDPAASVSAQDAEGDDSTVRARGAGEFLLTGDLPFTRGSDRYEANAETWRAWNPAQSTGRWGWRGEFMWAHAAVRTAVSGTQRASRAASGSVARYRFVQVETSVEGDPRWSAAAYRAWDGKGPTRTGLLLGTEARWRETRAQTGLRLEADAKDRLEGTVSLELRRRIAGGWNLGAAGVAPAWPHAGNGLQWRLTANYSRR